MEMYDILLAKALGGGSGGGGGGGGASNIFTGSFKYDVDTSQAKDITIPYEGTGHPVGILITVKKGVYGDEDFSTLVDRYVNAMFAAYQTNIANVPDYANGQTKNNTFALYCFKNSTSSADSYMQSGTTSYNIYRNQDAATGHASIVRFKNATTLSVWIATSAHGFKTGIEYEYIVFYSA